MTEPIVKCPACDGEGFWDEENVQRVCGRCNGEGRVVTGARILTCSMAEYFADPCAVPSLSQSLAHTLVTKSPLHAWHEHPRLGGGSTKSTRSTDRGSILGAMLLGTTDDVVERVPGFADFRKDDAKKLKAAAEAKGRVAVLDHQFDEYSEAIERIRERFAALGIRFTGASEVKLEWTEDSVHGPVLCRGMLDHYFQDENNAYDAKSIVSAHPDKCQKHMDEYGYDIQWAAYTSAMRKLRPGRDPRLGFLFFETEPPYAVNPVRPSESLKQLGEMRWGRGVNLWGLCRKHDKWPGYADGWTTVEARHWVLANEMARSA